MKRLILAAILLLCTDVNELVQYLRVVFDCLTIKLRNIALRPIAINHNLRFHFGLFHNCSIALFFLLLLAGPVHAGPKKVLGETVRFGLHALAVGSSVEFDRQTDLCRVRAGIEHCNGGYGEVTARQALNGIITAGAIGLSEWGRHENFKGWFLFEVGVTTYNGITAYQQSQIRGSRDEMAQASSLVRANRWLAMPVVQDRVAVREQGRAPRDLALRELWRSNLLD